MLLPEAQGATKTWNNFLGGNWNTGSNWDPDSIPPGPGDDAVISTWTKLNLYFSPQLFGPQAVTSVV